MSEAEEPAQSTDAPETLSSVTIHYFKPAGFQCAHADGAIGGATNRGLLNINFYSERRPIPQVEIRNLHETSTEGIYELGESKLSESISKNGLVRDLSFGVMMDLDTARAFHAWLGQHIGILTGVDEGGASAGQA